MLGLGEKVLMQGLENLACPDWSKDIVTVFK